MSRDFSDLLKIFFSPPCPCLTLAHARRGIGSRLCPTSNGGRQPDETPNPVRGQRRRSPVKNPAGHCETDRVYELGGFPGLCGIKHFEMGGIGLLQNKIGLTD